ncbi:MAG: hypothetical protein AB1689_29425 [Thermodesulfobacteriota bacterium]
MQRQGEGSIGPAVDRHADVAAEARRDAASGARGRVPEWTRCDACGTAMQSLGHCKWLCRTCGFLRTCIDTV